MATKRPVWIIMVLAQGIVAPVLFLVIAIVGGLLRPGYSHVSQAISELTEVGAVNKFYLDLSLLVMECLTILFAFGFLWVVRNANWHLKSSAAILVFIGILGLFFYRFPMDPMGTEMTFDGGMHLVIVTLSAIAAIMCVLLSAIGWLPIPGGHKIALISYTALAVMLFSGVVSALVGVWGWPGIGIWQRLNTSAFSIWEIATAIKLMRISLNFSALSSDEHRDHS